MDTYQPVIFDRIVDDLPEIADILLRAGCDCTCEWSLDNAHDPQ